MSVVEFKNVLMTSEDVKIEAGFNPAIEPSRLSENESGSTPIVNANAFPMAGMPDVLKCLISDLSSVYGSPNDFFAMSFLVACGGSARKRAVLDNGKYKNYPQLWAMIVAPSGVGKSMPIKLAFSKLISLDKALFEAYKADIVDWKAKCIACKVAQEVEPEKPYRKQFLIDDSTPEALYHALKINDGLTLYSDELSAWFDNFGRYSKNGEVSRYLSIFDNTTFDITRKGDEPLLVSEPYLSIIGGIQPKVLSDTLKLNHMRNNGFAQRFLFVYPDSVRKSHYINTAPNPALIADYDSLIEYLHSTDFGLLTLSVEAKELFIAFSNELTDTANATKVDYLKAMYSKFEIHCLRIALILELIKSFPNGLTINLVSADSVSYAIDLCRYFINSALKVANIDKSLEERSRPLDNISVAKYLVDQKGYSQNQAANILKVSQQNLSKGLRLRARL